MKLGIVTPVVMQLPDMHAPWEESAGIDEILRVAVEAERLGYHHVTCSHHVAVPHDAAAGRGTTYWDPWVTLGAIAAATSTIKLATFVIVLGYQHPLAVAKAIGTLDQVSEGRAILGVGVGSLREEFDLLGAPFEGRGGRADEALRVLRASIGLDEYQGFVFDPHATRRDVPIWVGGRTARSLRRAIELGDGWMPFGLRTAELAGMLERAPSRPRDLIFQNERPYDAIGDPEGTRAHLAKIAKIGATHVNVRVVHDSLDQYLEQLEALAGLSPDVR